ncbi:hypothetical protein THSYN_15850 [Candidatus Thiodictyon syntrophicum]|uniref:Uncharacterized protein n=2 Tax=Candidatus Thiodictyon syntrophicum TaxID=1166950 RepID=A0A2K8U9N9_9GAMM|nr:hypothetical protein THSYN_15850 [Candidatus Thiodictyon syntrophicum]
MGPTTGLVPPVDLNALQAELVELALGGVVEPRPGTQSWLAATGITRTTADGRLVADDDWLICSLPAPSDKELLVRSLLRDPLYRLHLDLRLAQIVTAVGVSGRWSRLEDLLFGELSPLAPRLAALVELARPADGVWEHADWDGLDALQPDTAAQLDERCWGISASAEAMFPVLRARYPAFALVPVFHAAADDFVASVVAAAALGESVQVPAEHRADLTALARRGLPLWYRALGDQTLEVTLSAPCRVRGKQPDLASRPSTRGVPAHARAGSALLPPPPRGLRASFWEIAETATSGLAFVGTAHRELWPADQDAIRRGLPRGEDLAGLARPRRCGHGAQDPADAALRLLCDHPLFGFWLQILLVEALDRELGAETLLLAPPTPPLVDDIEAATHLYYRPRVESQQQAPPLRDLGALDDAMTPVAVALGVSPVGVLGPAAGPWSLSLALLAHIGVAQHRHDRWTLSAHALDRLHGGGLMTGVIRRGRGVREHLHDLLEALWRKRADADQGASGV